MPVLDDAGRTVYVTGFLFATDQWTWRGKTRTERKVALIRKARPEWQRGLLNGIGGKVEPADAVPPKGEDYDELADQNLLTLARAMTREFHEESGVLITPGAWQRFATITSPRSRVVFYKYDLGVVVNALPKLRITTDEPCWWAAVRDLFHDGEQVVPSLRFLIPLAEQTEFSGSVTDFTWTDIPEPKS